MAVVGAEARGAGADPLRNPMCNSINHALPSSLCLIPLQMSILKFEPFYYIFFFPGFLSLEKLKYASIPFKGKEAVASCHHNRGTVVPNHKET